MVIIIKIDKIEDFVTFLDRRLGNEIFYETGPTADLGTRAILCYLAKIDGITVIYQGELTFPNVRDDVAIKKKLDEFKFENIRLIPGKIREIVMSIS